MCNAFDYISLKRNTNCKVDTGRLQRMVLLARLYVCERRGRFFGATPKGARLGAERE